MDVKPEVYLFSRDFADPMDGVIVISQLGKVKRLASQNKQERAILMVRLHCLLPKSAI